MTRARGAAIIGLAAAVGALIGLGISHLIAAPRGAEHSCSSGAPASACSYPPNYTQWTVYWILGCGVAGLVAGRMIINHRRTRSARKAATKT